MVDTVKVTAQVVRHSRRKEASRLTWEVTQDGKAVTYETSGSLILPQPKPELVSLLNMVADKAIKAAKIKAPQQGELVRESNGVKEYKVVEASPVIVTLVCDMAGKLLSSSQT